METILSRHIVIRSPSEPMREQILKSGENIIGRDPNCEIQVFDAGASRQHGQSCLGGDDEHRRKVVAVRRGAERFGHKV